MTRDIYAENLVDILEKTEDAIFNMQLYLSGLDVKADQLYNFTNEEVEKIEDARLIIGRKLEYFRNYIEERK